MKSLLLAAVGVIVLLPTQTRADEKAALAKLKGEYKAVTIQRGGKDAPAPVLKSKLVIEGNKFSIVSMFNGMERKSTLIGKIDDSKKPMHLDLSKDGKGRYTGIYKLDGKKLSICYNKTGEGRPTKFASPADSTTMLLIFEKEK